MGDYIHRDMAMARLTKVELTEKIPTMAAAKRAIADMPAADVLPVVRCKDCKYSAQAKWNRKGFRICPASHMEIVDDDFCSYAERKEATSNETDRC